jgi:hypothetical protein
VAFSICQLSVAAFGRFFWLDSFDTAVPQGMALVCEQRYASEAMSMSDQDDWEFAGQDDAKTEIRAAVGYLLRGATGGARGDIVQEIIAIVRQVASGASTAMLSATVRWPGFALGCSRFAFLDDPSSRRNADQPSQD